MKVLLLTGKFGLGHFSAATTLAEQIQESGLAQQVIVADIYEIAFPAQCELFYQVYAGLVGKGCKLYNLAYKKAAYGTAEKQNPVSRLVLKRLSAYLDLVQPDLIISTYSFAARLAADYKRQSGSKVTLVTCVTDVTCHNVWRNAETALYLVAAECTRQSLIEAGVAPERIAISGIPVRREFRQPRPEPLTESPVALLPKRPRQLLIMGGGLGLLPRSEAFYQALSETADLQVTIVCGQNRRLREKLSGRYANITVLGFTPDIATLMRRADLLISKPGGISTFEAIHSGLPLLVFSPFLEQEIKNAAFLQTNGLGLVLEGTPEDSLPQIQALLADTTLLNQIRLRMRRLREGLAENALLELIASLRGEQQGGQAA